MRAIVIDAENQEILEADVHKGDTLKFMQQIVDGLIQPAVDLERSGGADTVYVNEEGLFKGFDYAFSFEGAHQSHFVGNGVIMGCDYSTGATVGTQLTLDEVRDRVTT